MASDFLAAFLGTLAGRLLDPIAVVMAVIIGAAANRSRFALRYIVACCIFAAAQVLLSRLSGQSLRPMDLIVTPLVLAMWSMSVKAILKRRPGIKNFFQNGGVR